MFNLNLRGTRVSALTVVIMLASARLGLASCGATGCFLVTGTHEGLTGHGEFRLDLSYRWLEQDRLRRGSESASHVLTPHVDLEAGTIEPLAHRELRTLTSEMRLDIGYGLSPRLTLTAALPVLLDRLHEHREGVEAGHADELDAAHARATLAHGPAVTEFASSNTRGLGDIELGLRYGARVAERDQVLLGAAVKLPTGPHDLHDDEGAILEPALQPGTGGWGGILTLHASRALRPHSLDLFAGAALRIEGDSEFDYRAAPVLLAHLGVERALGPRLRTSLQLGLRRQGRDRFRGQDVPSTGFRELRLSPGLRYLSAGGNSAYAFVQIPVLQSVNEEQLAPGTALVFGVSRSF